MDLYDVNAYSSDEKPRRPKVIRHRVNYFEEWNEWDFFCRFRPSKHTVETIVDDIQETISYPIQSVAGDFCGVHKSTASKTIKRVSAAIAALRPRYIFMPSTPEEIRECRQKFYNIARFPRCIGAIDCSHVKIQSPDGNDAEIFRNRKQIFSINVQTVADSDLRIRDIVARWPGSSHEAHIFRNSHLCTAFENGRFGDSLLVGDSGYPIKNYLITPLLQTRNEAENLFNESLIRTTNVVERSYGLWKRRFPALALGLRLKVQTTLNVIVASAVLHNIACDYHEQEPPLNQDQEQAINFINNIGHNEDVVAPRGPPNFTRLNLINNHFARL
ncbi:hypothetical protein NQ315_004995 [Exocentrus adspersus]|uniref:DDE Tnp4 domain-containing protein n=1 Tax=Exocentrus adspersus TaxID=1586481 RepID=A0AAV8V7U9_9CUCU|nr:hypothetical protein NQ315_004995 [Exocentrus adspersus]